MKSFLADMLFGMQTAQSVVLGRIARGLREDVLLKKTEERLSRHLQDSINREIPPYGGDFVMYGGLYRDVHFIETDPVCIDSLTDGADNVVIAADPKTGEVCASVKVLGGTNEVQRFHFPNPKLWSPESPNLYTLHVEVRQKGSCDALDVPFGFRTAEFRADGFYLNGVRRTMKGVCRHQDKEGLGWALSVADHRADFALVKEMGADAVRFCHYPHASVEYALCDELGLLVWAEAPNVDGLVFSDARHEGFRDGLNDKGLVEFDHVTKKSGFHFYQTNWSKQPKLYLVGERMMETSQTTMNVMAFSNVGDVCLSVNGRVIGTQAPDAVKTVVFRDVPLEVGSNRVSVVSGTLHQETMWVRR